MRVRFLSLLALVAWSLPAWAIDAIPGEEKVQNLAGGDQKSTMGAQMGFAGIAEDFFLQLQLQSELNLGKVGVGLSIPLNLRVYDRDPQDSNDFFGVLRREDWDEPSEYFKVLRYVRFGQKRDPIYVRAGELAAEIGHGTIMSRYINNTDINTRRIGMQFDVNTSYGGVETIIGDVGSLFFGTPQSRIVGGRLYVKPLAFINPDSFFNRISVGTTVITDINAPLRIAKDDGGKPVTDGSRLKVAEQSAAVVYGFDTEIEVLQSEMLDITPYSDFNFIKDAGWGFHLGVAATARLPVGFDLKIPARLEYRNFRQNYVPAYFSTFYEVERFSYPTTGNSGTTKSSTVRDAQSGEGISGVFGDIAADFAGIVQAGFIYEDFKGGTPNVAGFLSVPALQVVQFKAYYARTRVEGFADAFKLDDRSMAVAQARYEMFPYVYLVGQFNRRWALASDGAFKAKDSYNMGVEVSMSF